MDRSSGCVSWRLRRREADVAAAAGASSAAACLPGTRSATTATAAASLALTSCDHCCRHGRECSLFSQLEPCLTTG